MGETEYGKFWELHVDGYGALLRRELVSHCWENATGGGLA